MHVGDLLAERFVLEALAGQGGMGEIYRAADRSTGQPVAIKLLRAHGGAAARFEREARLPAEVDDPLVVRYVAHGALPTGELYLAMEWLDGEDLAARLARAPLAVTDSVALAARVALGQVPGNRRFADGSAVYAAVNRWLLETGSCPWPTRSAPRATGRASSRTSPRTASSSSSPGDGSASSPDRAHLAKPDPSQHQALHKI